MIGWIIVVVLLLLILLMPLGMDISYAEDILTLKLKAGPVRWKLIPGKAKDKPDSLNQTQKDDRKDKTKSGVKLKISKDDLSTLLTILFRTLRRLGKHLSVDYFRLHWTAAASDPYDAVLQFGALNAVFGAVMPLATNVLKIRERDICSDVDFEVFKPTIDARVLATLQIWEILFIATCAGSAIAVWYLRKRKQARAAAKTASKKGMNHG